TKVTTAVPTVTTPAAVAPGLVKAKSPDTGDDDSAAGGDDATTAPVEDQPNDAGAAAPAEEPVLGQTLAVTPTDGTVRVRRSDGTWSDMTAGAALPNGSVVDARNGAITLAAAVDAAGSQQSATFSGAVFAVHQPSAAHSVTRLKLQ